MYLVVAAEHFHTLPEDLNEKQWLLVREMAAIKMLEHEELEKAKNG